ncbi:hypothetical protein GGF46_000425 [Coemansia sp. RSA 552]|nr:hypothetical protein GGF46_000425 [Coemansia sp. RSA 552]
MAEGAAGRLGRRSLGLGLLLCVVLIWTGSSFLVSNLFSNQEFNQPFFVTYLNTSTFSLYLVGVWAQRRRGRRRKNSGRATAAAGSEAATSGIRPRRGSGELHGRSQSGSDSPLVGELTAAPVERLGTGATVRLGAAFSLLWFAANAAQNASLAYTTVASSTVLCATSGLFTLAIGAAAGVEALSMRRVVAAATSIVGVYCIMRYGSADAAGLAPHVWMGDALALLSAALYGCYTTLLKRAVGDESRLDAPLFFGAVGVTNTLALWPGLVLLHITGAERFKLPATGAVWAMVAVNAVVGTLLSDYLWLRAVLLTSPLVVTLGLALTIPLGVAGDVAFKGLAPPSAFYTGAALVLGAFIAAAL